MIKPLEQFFCDTCGELINNPKEGWVEWISTMGEEGQTHSFKIVHHKSSSPMSDQNNNGCYQHTKKNGQKDVPLVRFLDEDLKMAYILKYLDTGAYHNPDKKDTNISDMRNYVETVRRLTIPFYEEARRYWAKAEDDGYFEGDNELIIFSVAKLKKLIEKYGEK